MTPELFGFSLKEILIAAFIVGGIWVELKAIRKDIARLEKKQDKYNNLQERTRVLEVKIDNHLNNGGR